MNAADEKLLRDRALALASSNASPAQLGSDTDEAVLKRADAYFNFLAGGVVAGGFGLSWAEAMIGNIFGGLALAGLLFLAFIGLCGVMFDKPDIETPDGMC